MAMLNSTYPRSWFLSPEATDLVSHLSEDESREFYQLCQRRGGLQGGLSVGGFYFGWQGFKVFGASFPLSIAAGIFAAVIVGWVFSRETRRLMRRSLAGSAHARSLGISAEEIRVFSFAPKGR